MLAPSRPPHVQTWRSSDGYVHHYRVWKSPGASRWLIYLHGIQSHGGWYEWSAALLAEAGLNVLMPDRRGSGLNAAARGDAPATSRLLCDLDELLDEAVGAGAGALAGIVGVSWGGKLAVAWSAARRRADVALLLIAPGIYARVSLGLAEKFAVARALLVSPRRTFPVPLDDPRLFTRNPDGQRFIASDPLALRHATARFLAGSARLDRRVRSVSADAIGPLTVLLAGDDRVIDSARTEHWALRVRRDAHIVWFPGAAHTLEYERDRDRFQAVLRRWAFDLHSAPQ